nr:unnamed protein product [Callosobruchus analis]
MVCADDMIFAVSENWLSKNISSDVVKMSNYSFFRQDRGPRGGGVGIYIKNKFVAHVLNDYSPNDQYLEYLWVKTSLSHHEIVICVLYRPPSCNLNECFSVLDDMIPFYLSVQ